MTYLIAGSLSAIVLFSLRKFLQHKAAQGVSLTPLHNPAHRTASLTHIHHSCVIRNSTSTDIINMDIRCATSSYIYSHTSNTRYIVDLSFINPQPISHHTRSTSLRSSFHITLHLLVRYHSTGSYSHSI